MTSLTHSLTTAAGIAPERVAALLDSPDVLPETLVSALSDALRDPAVVARIERAVAEAEGEAERQREALVGDDSPVLRAHITYEKWDGDYARPVGERDFAVPRQETRRVLDETLREPLWPRQDLDWVAEVSGVLDEHDGPFTVSLDEDSAASLLDWRESRG